MPAASAIRPIQEQDDLTEQPVEQATFALNRVPLPARIHFSRPLSDEELLQFCSENDGLEIESDADGSITVMTPAKWKTSRLNRYLEVELELWVRRTGTGESFGPDLGVRFADLTLRAPDAAWVSSAGIAKAEEQDKEEPGFLHFCPEFVAELRSHSDRASVIEAKMEFWMDRGAHLGWLIDPRRKLAMIYRAGRETETLLRPEFLEGDGPLAGFRLEMKKFWE